MAIDSKTKEKKEIPTPRETEKPLETDETAPESSEKPSLDSKELINQFFQNHTNENTRIQTEAGELFYSTNELVNRADLDGKSLQDLVDELDWHLELIQDREFFNYLVPGRDDFYVVEWKEGWYILTENKERLENLKKQAHEKKKQADIKEKIQTRDVQKAETKKTDDEKSGNETGHEDNLKVFKEADLVGAITDIMKKPGKIKSPAQLEGLWTELRDRIHNTQ